MPAPDLSRRTASLALGLLVLFALALRARGLDFWLPHYTQADGLILHDQVERLRSGEPPPPGYGVESRTYPHLLAHLALLLPDHGAELAARAETLEEHLFAASWPWIELRLLSISLAVVLVAGTYALGRRFLDRRASLFAAALAATSLLNVSLAQQERPHAAAASFALLAVLAAVHLRRSGGWSAYLLAGLAGAAAIGTLHSGLAVLVPLTAAFLLRRKHEQRASGWWVLAIVVLAALSIRAFYPFHFTGRGLRMPGLDEDDGGEFKLSGHAIWWGDLNGAGFLKVLGTMYSYDPLLLLTSVVGTLIGTVGLLRVWRALNPERRRDLGVVLAYALPYLLAIGIYRHIFERFVMPLLPYLAVVSAYGVARVLRALGAGSRPRVQLAVAALLLAFPTWAAWHLGSVRAAPDTQAEVATWLREHTRAGEDQVVVLPYLTLPLFGTEQELERRAGTGNKSSWFFYQVAVPPERRPAERHAVSFPAGLRRTQQEFSEDPIGHLEAIGADYVVIQDVDEGFRYEVIPNTLAALREHAVLEARFSPMNDGSTRRVNTRYLAPVLRRPFVLHELEARCMGSTIEIYRLP